MTTALLLVDIQNDYFPGERMALVGMTEASAKAAELMPNERETYRSLALKYAEPATPEATDAVCLDVILRNVEIRKGYDFDAATDGGRVIDLPRVGRRGD